MSRNTLVRILPLSLLAACNSLQDQATGSFPSDTNMVEFRAEMAELAEPGMEHEELKKRVGNWDLTVKSRGRRGGEWVEDKGTSTIVERLGGRYLVEQITGTLGGRPFEGYHVMGYSRLDGAFFSLWMDSHSTWPMGARGALGDDGVLRLHGRIRDVVTPAGRPFHIEETCVSDDEFVREFYDTIDGEPVKILEVTRTRRP